jgi:hypothetical protein
MHVERSSLQIGTAPGAVAAHRDGHSRAARLLGSSYDDAGATSVVRVSGWPCIDGPCVHGRVAGWCNLR